MGKMADRRKKIKKIRKKLSKLMKSLVKLKKRMKNPPPTIVFKSEKDYNRQKSKKKAKEESNGY